MAPKRHSSASDAVPDVKRPEFPSFDDKVEHFQHSEFEYSGSEDEYYKPMMTTHPRNVVAKQFKRLRRGPHTGTFPD